MVLLLLLNAAGSLSHCGGQRKQVGELSVDKQRQYLDHVSLRFSSGENAI